MIRHLTPDDYKTMPWANGKGVTVEMLRVEGPAGVKWRLSRASVVEAGDFSIFAGIERNLTVISGPGFDLVGQNLRLTARPLIPVAFSGEVAIQAISVTEPSDDFNVMTACSLPLPQVQVVHGARSLMPDGAAKLALFALGNATISGRALSRYDLLLTDEAVEMTAQDPVIAVHLF
ncbi:MAG: HutD family protein [Microgenomates group bacterium]